MDSSCEEMDGLHDTDPLSTPSPGTNPFSRVPFFYNSDCQHFSTKKKKRELESLRRNGTSTPFDKQPPPLQAKSAPPISRINIKQKTMGPESVSFVRAPSLDSPHYDGNNVEENYFEQLFENNGKAGSGSFGQVFKVRCKDDGEMYAVKQIQTNASKSSKYTSELEVLEKLPEHPNIVVFYNAWMEDDHLYMKMELCKESLTQYTTSDHSIPEVQAWVIFSDLVHALHHLHSHNLIHMDIKPDNIFITEDHVFKLGDLGLAIKDMQAIGQKNSHADDGDGRYLADEVLSNEAGKYSDIFSLGLTLLEVSTDLYVPKTGPPWHKIRDFPIPSGVEKIENLSQTLHDGLQWMMLKDFTARPTAENILQHPELFPKFQDRARKFNYQKPVPLKPGMPPLAELCRYLSRLCTPEMREPEGAVGGVAEDKMLDVSVGNDCRTLDEVDGLMPSCGEVLTKALLPQNPEVFAQRLARTEPSMRRTHNHMVPNGYFDSPVRFSKVARQDGGGIGAGSDQDDDETANPMDPIDQSSPFRKKDRNNVLSLRTNLLGKFEASTQETEDNDIDDNVAIDFSAAIDFSDHDDCDIGSLSPNNNVAFCSPPTPRMTTTRRSNRGAAAAAFRASAGKIASAALSLPTPSSILSESESSDHAMDVDDVSLSWSEEPSES